MSGLHKASPEDVRRVVAFAAEVHEDCCPKSYDECDLCGAVLRLTDIVLAALPESPVVSPAGRAPSDEALKAAVYAVDEVAQCECAETDGWSCFYRMNIGDQKGLCVKAAVKAAYAVDFPESRCVTPTGDEG